ncbi:MAG: tyrosine-protein phosphatase [Oscillospiraceae bacterium]
MVSVSSADRFIGIKGIENARQLGGYIGADGRKVRDGLLIRTAGLNKISDEAAKELSDRFHVKHVVDFRMEYERQLVPDKEIPGAENVWISVFEMDTNAPENIEMMNKIREAGGELQKTVEYAKTGRLSALYTDILLEKKGQKGYARFFDILLNNSGGAVLWHCTYGKDRTGVAAALLLCALGVDEDIIMQDFLISNEVYKDNIARLETELEKRGCDDIVIKEAQAMAGVKGEYLIAAFDAVKSEYGSVQNYIKNQLGVSDEKIKKLRDLYLE